MPFPQVRAWRAAHSACTLQAPAHPLHRILPVPPPLTPSLGSLPHKGFARLSWAVPVMTTNTASAPHRPARTADGIFDRKNKQTEKQNSILQLC